jgi:branched-chain amino acid transport system permease protein
MESAAIPERPPRSRGELAREVFSKYGLIVLLAAMPVWFGIRDLADDGDLSRLANNMKDGLSNGAIWALIAIGYTLVYGIIELINFAHGDLFMIGSFVAFGMIGSVGLTIASAGLGLFLGLLLILVISMIACGTLNVMIERVAYRPLRGAPELAPLITASASRSSCRTSACSGSAARHQRAGPDLVAKRAVLDRASTSTPATCCRGRDDPVGGSCS